MCGIVGFAAKRADGRRQLGRLVAPMLACMGDRGPDSAGLAVFSEEGDPRRYRYSLFAADGTDWDGLAGRFPDGSVEAIGRCAVLSTAAAPDQVGAALAARPERIDTFGYGRRMRVYKDAGHPRELIAAYRLDRVAGSHCVGHTRMATESAVTPAHSHPFTAGADFCLVHNGSISNPWQIRRRLRRFGIDFDTDNDTEAACRYLQWRMREGATIEAAIAGAFGDLDGFFTLLIGTADRLVLVRDAFACKPAVAAETDDYVAIGSEFRTLAHLPGIEHANLFEPAPEEIYSWSVPAPGRAAAGGS